MRKEKKKGKGKMRVGVVLLRRTPCVQHFDLWILL